VKLLVNIDVDDLDKASAFYCSRRRAITPTAASPSWPIPSVRKQLGIRESYKADARSEQTPARRAVRKRILRSLRGGEPLGIRLEIDERSLVEDGSGDLLDAVVCAMQAAWAAQRPRYGLPEDVPCGEGWILSAGTSS